MPGGETLQTHAASFARARAGLRAETADQILTVSLSASSWPASGAMASDVDGFQTRCAKPALALRDPESRDGDAPVPSRQNSSSCGAKSTMRSRPPGFQHARGFHDSGLRIVQIMQHLMEQHGVESLLGIAVRKRQAIHIGQPHLAMARIGTLQPVARNRQHFRTRHRRRLPRRINGASNSSIRPVPVPASSNASIGLAVEVADDRGLDIPFRRVKRRGCAPIAKHSP